MALISIHLLGPFQVSLSQEPLTGFATDKVRALLVYLALSPDHPHRREALAGLLWPEFPERSARNNLRNALANLRQVIGDGVASPPFLHCTRQTIQFNGQSDYWLDADAFEDLLALHPTMSVKLEQAVNLVRGRFLEGFTLADSVPFDEWLLLRREHYGRLMIQALDKLISIHEGHGAFELALAYARRRVELEPWRKHIVLGGHFNYNRHDNVVFNSGRTVIDIDRISGCGRCARHDVLGCLGSSGICEVLVAGGERRRGT